jgi:hypothetical protein
MTACLLYDKISSHMSKSPHALIKSLRVSKKTHARYIDEAKWFCRSYDELLDHLSKSNVVLKKTALVKSDLFGLEYLVGYVDPTWLKMTAPGCNAIATTSFQFGELGSPPIVLLPNQKKSKKNSAMHSIIEHEFVHINQALRDRFPSNFEDSIIDLSQQFVEYAHAEFEANYLQLSFWPELSPKQYKITLKDWCFLRGYTQALERFLLSGILGKFPEEELFSTLQELPAELRKLLVKIGSHSETNLLFIKQLKPFSVNALSNMISVESLNRLQVRTYKRVLEWTQEE